jgi:hypothetical protein
MDMYEELLIDWLNYYKNKKNINSFKIK